MGQQIGVGLSPKDEQVFIEVLKAKFNLWSLPWSFDKDEGIPLPLGAYANSDQMLFFESAIATISTHFIATYSRNWETGLESATGKYSLHTPENFYLEWSATSIQAKTTDTGQEANVYLGRFYMPTEILPYKKAPSSELKKLYAFISRYIKTHFSYMTNEKKPTYIGDDLATLILSGKLSLYTDIIKNPQV